jgi:glycolate oxidase subunit GlcD
MDSHLLKRLREIVGREHLLDAPEDLAAYAYDASLARGRPDAVVFPSSEEEVCRVVKAAWDAKVPVVPRGAGTNLSGGAVPTRGGIVIVLTGMNRILEIDIPNQRAVVEPGVLNQQLQDALAPLGFFYAPDPASQRVSTLGGNVAENSGGPHCIKYGVTVDHVLGLEVVLPDGTVTRWGSKALGYPGPDMGALWVGSEGILGIVTRITLRIMPKAEEVVSFLALYDSMEQASRTVAAIIERGLSPSTLEMMDKVVMEAVEMKMKAGYPLDAEAVLIIEFEGFPEELEETARSVREICLSCGARDVQQAGDPVSRDRIWAGRRGAFGAIGQLSPAYLVCDGTVPRDALPRVLARVREIGRKYDLTIGNVFHAGDGNLHPLILFDERNPTERSRVEAAGREILEACVREGGNISGEHGIGIEKLGAMSLVFSEEEMAFMRSLKEALDPVNQFNPGKLLQS